MPFLEKIKKLEKSEYELLKSLLLKNRNTCKGFGVSVAGPEISTKVSPKLVTEATSEVTGDHPPSALALRSI